MVAISLAVNRSQAAFVLLEDFNNLTNGFINGQQGWVDSASNGRVVADPLNPSNKVIAITNVQANIYRALGSLSISNNATGTLHFRMSGPARVSAHTPAWRTWPRPSPAR